MGHRLVFPLIVAAATALSLALSAGAAAAGATDTGTADEAGVRYALGLLAGSTRMDGALADYQWDTRPRLAWGAIALVGRGRLAGGMRAWTSQNTQRIDPSATAGQSTIRSSSFELLGRLRIARVGGAEVHATASAGRLQIGRAHV